MDKVRGRDEAVEAIRDAQDDPDVLSVAVDSKVTVEDLRPANVTAAAEDPLRASQWGLDRLKAETVWPRATGTGAVVAVIDTGVDGTHPDLAGQLTTAGAEFLAGGRSKSTGNGRTDRHSHGTHVTGEIVALRGNGVGIAGLAPSAKVMPVRTLDANGSGWNSDIALGVIYATDHNADVINMSMGGPVDDPTLATAISYALKRGVIVVAAAGNARTEGNAPSYPAAHTGVVAVGSFDEAAGDPSSYYSNTGSYLAVSAPGSNIVSTIPGGYAIKSGTSMSTPYVSATAALAVDATDGTITSASFRKALTGTAEDRGAVGFDKSYGYGVVNPSTMVCTLMSCSGSTPTPKQAVNLGFRAAGGHTTIASTRTVLVGATDAATGSNLAGQRVRVSMWRDGSVWRNEWVTTDANGNAELAVSLWRNTRFTLHLTETATRTASSSAHSISWYAVPDLGVRFGGNWATVDVTPRNGQWVVMDRFVGGRWTGYRNALFESADRAAVRGLPNGTYRFRASTVAGIRGATSGAFTLR